MKYILTVCFSLLLTACALTEKPNNALAYTSDQILELGKQIRISQDVGELSETEGDKYLDMLITANKVLGGSISLYRSVEDCKAAQSKMQCVVIIVTKVQEAL